MQRADEDTRTADLRRFLDVHYRRVVGSVSLISGDRSTAEDAVQQAIVTAWRRRDEPIDRLAAWITVVASNEARSERRRDASRQRVADRVRHDVGPLDATTSSTGQPASTDPAMFDTDLIDPDLSQALAGLPLRERQAAVLFYVFDLSVADAATAMAVSAGTVKTLLSRARSHLADALGGQANELTGGVA